MKKYVLLNLGVVALLGIVGLPFEAIRAGWAKVKGAYRFLAAEHYLRQVRDSKEERP